MNYSFFFFLCASIVLVLSVISICTAPIINSVVGGSWGNRNCNYFSDDYNYQKKKGSMSDQQLKELKRHINVCKREKAMHGLEYSSLICDITFGGICALLGLLHYLEVGKTIEKKTGLIGIIAGTIGFVLTLVYVIFSGYIFNNDYYYTNDNNYESHEKKLFPNGAYLKWNGYKYVHNYDEEKVLDDSHLAYIKWKDLGLKQYNYDSELYKNSYITGATFATCNRHLYDGNYITDCNYVWETSYNKDKHNKYIYDRWITTLILSAFISVLNIGVILFGFFLFTQSESSPGGVLLPVVSTNAV